MIPLPPNWEVGADGYARRVSPPVQKDEAFEAKHPRGKTTEGTNAGSFAPAEKPSSQEQVDEQGRRYETFDLGINQFKDDLVKIATKLGVKGVDFGNISTAESKTELGYIVGQFSPLTGRVTLDIRSMLMYPAHMVVDVVKHEAAHSRMWFAWVDKSSGLSKYINENFDQLRKDGTRYGSTYAKAFWRLLDKTRSKHGSQKWNDLASAALNETYAEFAKMWKVKEWPESWQRMEAMIAKHSGVSSDAYARPD